jgi:hypothetical protein
MARQTSWMLPVVLVWRNAGVGAPQVPDGSAASVEFPDGARHFLAG